MEVYPQNRSPRGTEFEACFGIRILTLLICDVGNQERHRFGWQICISYVRSKRFARFSRGCRRDVCRQVGEGSQPCDLGGGARHPRVLHLAVDRRADTPEEPRVRKGQADLKSEKVLRCYLYFIGFRHGITRAKLMDIFELMDFCFFFKIY